MPFAAHIVEQFGNRALAGPCFTSDDNGIITFRHLGDLFAKRLHGGIGSDHDAARLDCRCFQPLNLQALENRQRRLPDSCQ